MFLSHLSKREKNLALLVVVAGAAFLIYNFLLDPMLKKISVLNSQIATQETKWKRNQRVLGQEIKVSGQYQKYAELMQLKVSEEQEMANLLSEIESVAQGVKIRILDMKPKKIRNVDFYKNFSVDLTIDGPIKEITQFIYDLQNLPHLIKVEKLRMEKESTLQPTLKAYLLVSKVLIP